MTKSTTEKAELLDLVGLFTWFWNDYFHIETEKGNFIWSDPEYGGDNSICPTKMSVKEFCKAQNVPYGRDKGRHVIGQYCGPDITFE